MAGGKQPHANKKGDGSPPKQGKAVSAPDKGKENGHGSQNAPTASVEGSDKGHTAEAQERRKTRAANAHDLKEGRTLQPHESPSQWQEFDLIELSDEISKGVAKQIAMTLNSLAERQEIFQRELADMFRMGREVGRPVGMEGGVVQHSPQQVAARVMETNFAPAMYDVGDNEGSPSPMHGAPTNPIL